MALNEKRDSDPAEFRQFPAEEGQKSTPPAEPDGANQRDPEIEDDALEFVVTEAHQDSPELVGMDNQPTAPEDLGLQSTADLMNEEAFKEQPSANDHEVPTEEAFTPIGQSEPPPPPAADDALDQPEPLVTEPPAQGAADPNDLSTGDRLAKLSEQEVKAINDELYGDKSYLTEQEKQNLVKSLDEVPQNNVLQNDASQNTDRQDNNAKADSPSGDAEMVQSEAPAPDVKNTRFEEQPEGKPFANTPIEPPRKSQAAPVDPSKVNLAPDPDKPRPAMARRQRGIAFFYKNFIQVQGALHFRENDELRINDREYVLKPKVISPKLILAGAASVFVLLLVIVGLQFASFGGSGNGGIVGMALDEYDQPYLGGAEIRLPETGKTVSSNPQGFFSIEGLPAGPHQIDYVVAGVVVGSDYATVTDDELTTVTLRPSPELSQSESERQTPKTVQASTQKPSEPVQTASAESPQTSSSSAKSSKKSSQKQSTQPNARLALAANVDGATLKLDNKVIGAGNLTYAKLSPGKHSYEVSKLGFEPASGSITLKGDQTRTLTVALTPASQEAREEVFTARDFLESGAAYLRSGEIKAALSDLSSAISKEPSYAEAYFARAQANSISGRQEEALADYLRAAEIFQIQKEYNQAITSYGKAIEIDDRELAPLLGRGNVYLAKGEEIAAIADFESARKIDKKSAQARIGLGKARFNQGYYKKAAKEFKEAREEDPKNPMVHQYLMLSYMAANDTKNVRKSYEKFQKVATQEQLEQLRNDQRFVAIMRIIDADS